MKKIVIAVIIGLVVFCGCEDNSTEPENETIIGTWNISSMTRDGVELEPDETVDVIFYKLVFNEDNSGTSWGADYGVYEDEEGQDFEWTTEDNDLIFELIGGDSFIFPFTLNDNTLTVQVFVDEYLLTKE